MNMKSEELCNLLIERWGYKDHSAEHAAEKILNMDNEILAEFDAYVKTDRFSKTYKLFGLSPATLGEAYPLKPPAVFLLLDWIKRDPVSALDALMEEYRKPLPKSFNAQSLKEYLSEEK